MYILKKLKKIKGFTLIELLAVIVILIIVMLIAFPSVLGTIEDARKKSFETTVQGLISAATNECMTGKVKNEEVNRDIVFDDYEMPGETLNFKGRAPKAGTIRVNDNCEVAVALKNDNFCVKKGFNNKKPITSELNESGECIIIEYIGANPACTVLENSLNVLIEEEGYIPIATANDLNNIRYNTNNTFGTGTSYEAVYTGGLDKKYIQIADIDLSSYPNWQPLGHAWNIVFSGSYDGGGHVITNFVQDVRSTAYEYTGLFGIIERTTSGFIRNLGIVDAVVINDAGEAAILAGSHNQYDGISIIENIFITGSIQTYDEDWPNAAGLTNLGHKISELKIKDNYVSVSINADQTNKNIEGVINCDHYYDLNSSCNSEIEFASNVYFNKDLANYADFKGTKGRTTTEMQHPQAANTYEGWDFSETWMIDPNLNDGYPLLRKKQILDKTEYEELKNECEYEVTYITNGGVCPNNNTVHGSSTKEVDCQREGYHVSNFSLADGICANGFDNKTGQCKDIRSDITVNLSWDLPPTWTFEFRTTSNNESVGLGFLTPNLKIDWGDGNTETLIDFNEAYVSHLYATPGIYEVTLSGVASQITFCSLYSDNCQSSPTTPTKLYDVKTKIPSNMGLTSARGMFARTAFISFTEEDFFNDISGNIKDLSWMFSYTNFNGNVANWNTSNVTDMNNLFSWSSNFNQDIGNWNTSNVENMSGMFALASTFNQNLESWDTSNVKNMNYMFNAAYDFNGNISTWETPSVESMNFMFYSASSFNQNIGGWNTSNVTDMEAMFAGANAFNQNIGNWDTSNVDKMGWMFWGASAFNQNLSGWCVSKIPSKPGGFDSSTAAWSPKAGRQPVWGTCP